jgi:hypothetical protein
MSHFRVFPIPDSVARDIREKRVDEFGHQLGVSISTENDTGPCRSCLKVIRPGEGQKSLLDPSATRDFEAESRLAVLVTSG